MENNTRSIFVLNYVINPDGFPKEILDLPDQISLLRKKLIERNHGDVSKFIYTLYGLWFVEKLQRSEIATVLHLSPINIHDHLNNFRWNYSQDYSENQILAKKDFVELQNILNKAKENSKNLNLQDNSIYLKAMATKLQTDAFTSHGFKNKEEYVKVLFLLINEFRISTQKISVMFNESIATTHNRLRTLGLHQSYADGITGKKARKSQNYTQSINRGKISRLNNQIKNLSMGSINEDFVRNQLSLRLFEFIDSDRYDIVVGVNNTGNLGSREIDIPVIVWDNSLQKIYRFAIEYNADYYHENKNDEEKKEIAKKRGWIYIPIIEITSNNFSNDKSKLLKVSIDLCKKIQSLVN
jgi:hypothetical protein